MMCRSNKTVALSVCVAAVVVTSAFAKEAGLYQQWLGIMKTQGEEAGGLFLKRLDAESLTTLARQGCDTWQAENPRAKWRSFGMYFVMALYFAEAKTDRDEFLKMLLAEAADRSRGVLWRERILNWVGTEHRKRWSEANVEQIMSVCRQLVRNKEDDWFVRACAARCMVDVVHAPSWKFYMKDVAFRSDQKKMGTALAAQAARKRGLENPLEPALGKAIQLLCSVIADRQEDEAVCLSAAGGVGHALKLCTSLDVLEAAHRQLTEVSQNESTAPATFICVTRHLVEVYADKTVLTVLRKRARNLRDDGRRVQSLIRDAEDLDGAVQQE